MKRWVIVVVIVLALVVPARAWAECAWVLWQELITSDASGLSSEWQIGQAGSEQACATRLAAQVRDRVAHLKTLNETTPNVAQNIEVFANQVNVLLGKLRVSYRFLCLPDTIDPRGAKR